MALKARRNSKYQRIYDHFKKAILEGALKAGDQLPTEAELCEEFQTSRPTAARALRQLVDEGLLRRRAGSGTFVSQSANSKVEGATRRLGLLIPGLGDTEIFEPICAQIAAVAEAQGFDLLWGSGRGESDADPGDAALALCKRYIEQGVEGVFFAPLELDRGSEGINRQIVESLQRQGIVVILLDRDLGPFPRRSDCDLVALDNLRGGYLIAAHLLRQRCTRIDFLALPHSAQTITQRLEGVRAALYDAGIIMPKSWVHTGQPDDPDFIQHAIIDAGVEAVVCSNDVTAATLMTTLSKMGIAIPEQIRICGFDDVKYAAMLRVPLTTIKQPCADIGRIAVLTMMERFKHNNLPGRKIMLTPQLIVRESSGK